MNNILRLKIGYINLKLYRFIIYIFKVQRMKSTIASLIILGVTFLPGVHLKRTPQDKVEDYLYSISQLDE